jgi:hypothetical protein
LPRCTGDDPGATLDRVRVTGEWLRIASSRDQRILEGLAARQLDRQLQLSVRLLF